MLYLAADHGGFRLKENLKRRLAKAGFTFRDFSSSQATLNDDYPILAGRVAAKVSQGSNDRGLLLCRSGVGMGIVANKFRGVRAVVASDVWTARRSRRDENVNVLTLPAERLAGPAAWAIVRAWLAQPFRNAARDRRRLRQLQRFERGRR